ncbi:hypothetical protein J4475_00235 [Candidatus Woesearchaeota archaeon]|nr:hypothetical protein [Candidatus Woesearchaeota archaeon]
MDEDFSEDDDNPYDSEEREKQVDDDEIGADEAGFIAGYEGDEKTTICQKCGRELDGVDFIEVEHKGEKLGFCSEKCAEEYERNQ